MVTVQIPDVGRQTIPGDSSLSVEEVRRALVTLGFNQVQSSNAYKAADGTYVFERAIGGTKGR